LKDNRMTDQTPATPPGNPWWRPPMRDVLATLSTMIFAGAMVGRYTLAVRGVHLDSGTAEGVGQFDGAAIAQWVGVMGWYFGSSKSSVPPAPSP
jgi:hypothetical protein